MKHSAQPRPAPAEADEAGQAPDLLEYIAEPAPQTERRIDLPSGRVVEARAEPDGHDRVTIRSAQGEVELEVRMTERGPVLRFRAADVELESARDVRVSCDNFRVQARGSIAQESGGDLKQRIGGNATVKVRGKHTVTAAEARVEAKRGSVQIEANDDVEIAGERVKLNC